MARIYRTAQGKQVDMGALLLRNENVRAVGNMGVNAKGDVINNKNKKIIARNEQVNKQYRKQIRNQVVDVPVRKPELVIKKPEPEIIKGLDTAEEPIVTQETIKKEVPKEEKKTGGLASAIAKARQVEQVKQKTPREEARGKSGVKRI
jgi:hypothetical protein